MTYINLTTNSANINNVQSKYSIFSLMLKNPRSLITSNMSGIYHDSFHLIYSNNTSQSNCPILKYKPYISSVSSEIDYNTYNYAYLGNFANINDTTHSTILSTSDLQSQRRFFAPSLATTISHYAFTYLRLCTGSSTNLPLYAIGPNNPYRPEINRCVIPKIVLKGGFEYYIEIINSSNRIKFDINNISLKKSSNPLVDSSLSKIHINNDSYNPHLYATYVNRNSNESDIFSLSYIFDDYNSLSSQWGSRVIIHQIPII